MPTYRLDCTGCSFTTTVDGDFDAVMDRIDDHAGDEPAHFVEFEVVEW